MKIFCLYYKDEFAVSFPNREDCVEYGKKYYEGVEWDCSILVKYLHDAEFYTSTSPIVPYSQPLTSIPGTQPITVPSPPYTPNILCDVKAPKATYEWNETGDNV